jgi:hypothetical protein
VTTDSITPGPWMVGPSAVVDGATDYAILADGKIISEAFGRSSWQFEYDSLANARLIAAAPDLLAALERTLSWLTSYPGEACMRPSGPYAQARAAIAKATGATP